MNLVVQEVWSTAVLIGWELSEPLPSTQTSTIRLLLHFHIKFYPVLNPAHATLLERRQLGHKENGNEEKIIELSIERKQSAPQSNYYSGMIQGLLPGTEYEFSVCLLQPLRGQWNSRTNVADMKPQPFCWSMVERFKTNDLREFIVLAMMFLLIKLKKASLFCM